MNNREVVKRFLAGKPGKGSNLQTDGSTLWSYDYVLAWYHNDSKTVRYNIANTGTVLGYQGPARSRIYDAAYSPSTNRHRDILLREMYQAGYPVYHANGGKHLGDVIQYEQHVPYSDVIRARAGVETF